MNKDNKKNSNSTYVTKSLQQQHAQNKQMQQQDNETSLWVRNFVAISNSITNFGKGLCWIFGSFIILGVVILMLMGDIGSSDLMDVAKTYLKK